MSAQRISPIVPTRDVVAAANVLAAVLDCAPTFVNGTRWAQFDVGGSRVMLAGTDRETDEPSLAVKVDSVATAVARLRATGFDVGPVTEGPHERRAVTEPGHAFPWPVVLYEPTG